MRCDPRSALALAAGVVLAVVGGGRLRRDTASPRPPAAPITATARESPAERLTRATAALDRLEAELFPYTLRETPAQRCRHAGIDGAVLLGAGDAVGGEGTIDASGVARTVRSALAELRHCYTQARGGRFASVAQVEVRFTVGEHGRPSLILPTGSSDPAVLACFEQVFRTLTFPEPVGGLVDFRFPFTLCPACPQEAPPDEPATAARKRVRDRAGVVPSAARVPRARELREHFSRSLLRASGSCPLARPRRPRAMNASLHGTGCLGGGMASGRVRGRARDPLDRRGVRSPRRPRGRG